jgi:hypothetical protein
VPGVSYHASFVSMKAPSAAVAAPPNLASPLVALHEGMTEHHAGDMQCGRAQRNAHQRADGSQAAVSGQLKAVRSAVEEGKHRSQEAAAAQGIFC